MHRLTIITAAVACLAQAPLAFSASQLYLETGVGGSQYSSSLSASTLNDASVSPSAKVLIGSRLNHSPYAWFELMYNYNAKVSYANSAADLSSHMVSTGVKLTSAQTAPLSAFIRGGIGKVFLSPNSSSTINKNQYYFGGGISYRFANKSALNVEYQKFIIPDVDTDTNLNTFQIDSSAVYLTLKQDID
ncbi:MAG: outer membrane beta-barrel protein [Bermanella sp.]